MSVSDALSTFLKIRRVMAIVSIGLAAAGYKVGPKVWHQAQDKIGARSQAKTTVKTETTPGIIIGTATNSETVTISSRDLGEISMTNHLDTCVPLGAGKDCVLTPVMIDKRNVQITVALETKTAKGKVHDLSITQVVARSGKPFEVAVGQFSFSLTPNVVSE
jgi:hypothetical protein